MLNTKFDNEQTLKFIITCSMGPTVFQERLHKGCRRDYPYSPSVPISALDQKTFVTLRSLFEAARWAASSYNEQPWNYVVAKKEIPKDLRDFFAAWR